MMQPRAASSRGSTNRTPARPAAACPPRRRLHHEGAGGWPIAVGVRTTLKEIGMKLYDFPPAVNARRARAFIAEKGLEVPVVEVDVRAGVLHEEPYRSMNPFARRAVPRARRRHLHRRVDCDLPLSGGGASAEPADGAGTRRSAPSSRCGTVASSSMDSCPPSTRCATPDAMYAGRVLPGTRNDLRQSPEIAERGKAAPRDPLRPAGRAARRQPVPSRARASPSPTSPATSRCRWQPGSAYRIPAGCSHLARWHGEVSDRPSTRA